MKILKTHRCFNGVLYYIEHPAKATGLSMAFTLYLPDARAPLPALTWLSGLTCGPENFTTKAGAYGLACDLGMVLIAPDTSPRGKNVADDSAYDLGQGAGFYVDATEEPWCQHFKMYSYITRDLQTVVAEHFPIDIKRQAISGHSMGGHGALTIGLKHPEIFKSISAFAPICAPSSVPWGQKAFQAYLGPNKKAWEAYDACHLVKKHGGKARGKILIDQGTADEYLREQLQPERFQQAAAESGQSVTVRMRGEFDHSYFFISSFIGDHLKFHRHALGTGTK